MARKTYQTVKVEKDNGMGNRGSGEGGNRRERGK